MSMDVFGEEAGPPLVKGGQGRSGEELTEGLSSWWRWVLVSVLAWLALALIAGAVFL